MIFWIFGILGIAFGVYLAVDCWLGCFGGTVVSVLSGFCGLLIALLVVIFISCFDIPYLPPQVVESTEIMALRDTSNISGSVHGGIFCASGYVDEEPVYAVLVNTDLGMQTKAYKAENTYIQFTDETPRVKKLKYKATGFWNFFCGDGFLDATAYIIYIPTDSQVVSDYVIDLE